MFKKETRVYIVCVRERWSLCKMVGWNGISGTKTITIKHRHGHHLSTGSFREDTTIRTNIFSFAPFPNAHPIRSAAIFFPASSFGLTAPHPSFPLSLLLCPTQTTMTFLSSLHRIAPIAATARRAVKPAFSSAYAVSQQRFNSSSTVEVTKKKKTKKRAWQVHGYWHAFY